MVLSSSRGVQQPGLHLVSPALSLSLSLTRAGGETGEHHRYRSGLVWWWHSVNVWPPTCAETSSQPSHPSVITFSSSDWEDQVKCSETVSSERYFIKQADITLWTVWYRTTELESGSNFTVYLWWKWDPAKTSTSRREERERTQKRTMETKTLILAVLTTVGPGRKESAL